MFLVPLFNNFYYKIMYIYHYKIRFIELPTSVTFLCILPENVFADSSVYIRRLSLARPAEVHVLGSSFLTFCVFWTSKALHYISRREETTRGNQMGLDRVPGHS